MKPKRSLNKKTPLWRILGLFLILGIVLITMTFFSQKYTVITVEHHVCKIESPQFSLSWIHSVDKTPWYEHYERTTQGFKLTHSIFKTFGAGVPHDGKVLPSNDGMIHYEMNQSIAEINWIIDKDVRSTLRFPDNVWEIYKTNPRYTEVQIRNQSLNFWQRLIIRNCHES